MIDAMIPLPVGLLASTGDQATWVLLGRLHPLLVHFPIAMILAAAAVELVLVFRRESRPSTIASFCVWVGTVFACLATWCGWALGEESGGGDALELHRWFGVAASGVLVAVVICWIIERVSHSNWSFQAYRGGLWGGAVLIVVTSVYGGDMVWGEDWLKVPVRSDASSPPAAVEPASDATPAVATPVVDDDAAAKADASKMESGVIALLTDRCESCHGPVKQRGDLQLIPLAMAFPGDASDAWSVQPGKPDDSELYKRIILPADHDDRMPPKGEPLTTEQVQLVREWITAGAPHGASASNDDAGSEDVDDGAGAEPPAIADAAAFDQVLQSIAERGGVVAPLHQGSDWYEVNVSIAKPAWTDADLDLLGPVAGNLWSLNLGRSAVTDAGMVAVASCVNLRTLKLNGTAITDAGVKSLGGLRRLERLNLYGTSVGDPAIDVLEKMPALTHVYLWGTKVTRLGVDTLRVARPEMVVDSGAGTDTAPEPEADETPASAPEPPPAPEEQPEQAALPGCCQDALALGKDCDHACCVQARANGEICSKCALDA
jgi:uncharacterized membrane protein